MGRLKMNSTCNRFGSTCKSVWINNFRILSGEWYLLDITPTPVKSELRQVITGIENEREIAIEDGRLIFNKQCSNDSDEISEEIELILEYLKPVSYKIAVFNNRNQNVLRGQPIAFSISPKIDFLNFPDHPHLNTPNVQMGIPASFCYTDSPNMLGEFTSGDRMLDALLLITEWAFRHQIWQATRKKINRGCWVGKQLPTSIQNYHYPHFLDSNEKCHCGSGIKYKKCCYQRDKSDALSKGIVTFDRRRIIEIENSVFNKLREHFQ